MKTTSAKESPRQHHERLLREEPARAHELHCKLSAEMLMKIIEWMAWYGESEEETADAVFRYFDGMTKEEISTASKQVAYIAKSTVFQKLRARIAKAEGKS